MLISINTEYPPIQIDIEHIQEIWQVTSKLTFDIETGQNETTILQDLQTSINNLKKDIENLKS